MHEPYVEQLFKVIALLKVKHWSDIFVIVELSLLKLQKLIAFPNRL
jgi:hypothetical protein